MDLESATRAALDAAVDRLAIADDDELPSAIAALLDVAGRAGATSLTLAAHPVGPTDDRVVADAGLAPIREMLQLRRHLPFGGDAPAPLATRAFRPGVDDEAWLAVNNRAFAWHPEQADWTAAHLTGKTTEAWFDPEGFLLHEDDAGAIDGFCWTKVHPPTADDPAMGEIFVIAVDPGSHGRGLGRALVLAGLGHLADRGLSTALLYVEADNGPARRLYDDLGFTVHERHRWWTGRIPPPVDAPPVAPPPVDPAPT